MHICIYVFMYMCIYIYVCIYIYINAYIHTQRPCAAPSQSWPLGGRPRARFTGTHSLEPMRPAELKLSGLGFRGLGFRGLGFRGLGFSGFRV